MQSYLKTFLFISFLCNISIITSAQSKTIDSVHAIVQAIAKGNVYEKSYTVGYAGSISKQHERFEQLLAVATAPELLHLAQQHPNAVVRLYAYQAFKRKNAVLEKELLLQFANDHSIVFTTSGCVREKRTVRSVLADTGTTSIDTNVIINP